ncbi:MAG: endonuclease/exonuclease/phosphatase family protein [Woeseiaceae bacterium]
MRNKYVSLIGLLQAAAVLTIGSSVVTAMPVDHVGIQLFTHFKLQYLVASVLLCVALALLRRPFYVAGLLLAVGLNASLVVPWYVANAVPPGGKPVTILSANILSSNTEHQRLFELLDAEAPDIVFLQEVSPQWLEALVRLRQDYPYSYTEARDGNFGMALFSRLPFTSVSHVDSPPLGYPTIVATIDVDGAALQVVGSHPMIPVSAQFYADRNAQFESIAELFAEWDGPRVLLGDLNTSMWDINYRQLEDKTGLRNARLGFGVVPTWPTFMPFAMIPIDHVLLSGDISVVELRSGPRIGSDHLPLIVTLAL